MLKAIILNDTTRDFGHWGCINVINNITALCQKHHCEISYYDKNCHNNFDISDFQEQLKPADIVILNGEGTLHDNAGQVWLKKALIAKEQKKKLFLVNSVWQNNPQTKEYLSLFNACSFRESFSYNEALKDGCKNAFKVPDLSFYSYPNLQKLKKTPSQKLAIVDSVKKDISSELIKLAQQNKCDMFFMYYKHWQKYHRNVWHLLSFKQNARIKHLSSAELLTPYQAIISGRFHACCMSLMLGIPTFAVESNTWKLNSLLQDANLDKDFYAKTPKQAYELYLNAQQKTHILWQQQSSDFSNHAYKTINDFWDSLF